MGWIVGGILVLMVGVLIGWLILFPSPSDTTSDTTDRGAMDYQEVKLPLNTVVSVEPSGSGDAGEDYKQAIDIVKPIFEENRAKGDDRKPQTILSQVGEDLASWITPSDGSKPECKPVNQESLKLLERIAGHVADGAAKKEMKYPYDLDAMEVTYMLPEARYFRQVSQALCDYAYYQQICLKKPELSQKTLFNRVVMGWHLSRNRVYPYCVKEGFDIQISACIQLKELYEKWEGHASLAENVDQYQKAAEEVVSFFKNKKTFLFDRFAREKQLPNPGDIFNVVENDKDPCWRIQGIFAMGMLKYSPALEQSENYRGDTRVLKKLIAEKQAKGTDEEKAAIKAALKLTKEEYDNLATKNADY
jgi:hypothetical protein